MTTAGEHRGVENSGTAGGMEDKKREDGKNEGIEGARGRKRRQRGLKEERSQCIEALFYTH